MTNGPNYDLAKAQQLTSADRYATTRRVRSYLLNHGYEVDNVVHGVSSAMQPDNFLKSTNLAKEPYAVADVYRHVIWEDLEWYVKFFIASEEEERTYYWSLKEDGYSF